MIHERRSGHSYGKSIADDRYDYYCRSPEYSSSHSRRDSNRKTYNHTSYRSRSRSKDYSERRHRHSSTSKRPRESSDKHHYIDDRKYDSRATWEPKHKSKDSDDNRKSSREKSCPKWYDPVIEKPGVKIKECKENLENSDSEKDLKSFVSSRWDKEMKTPNITLKSEVKVKSEVKIKPYKPEKRDITPKYRKSLLGDAPEGYKKLLSPCRSSSQQSKSRQEANDLEIYEDYKNKLLMPNRTHRRLSPLRDYGIPYVESPAIDYADLYKDLGKKYAVMDYNHQKVDVNCLKINQPNIDEQPAPPSSQKNQTFTDYSHEIPQSNAYSIPMASVSPGNYQYSNPPNPEPYSIPLVANSPANYHVSPRSYQSDMISNHNNSDKYAHQMPVVSHASYHLSPRDFQSDMSNPHNPDPYALPMPLNSPGIYQSRVSPRNYHNPDPYAASYHVSNEAFKLPLSVSEPVQQPQNGSYSKTNVTQDLLSSQIKSLAELVSISPSQSTASSGSKSPNEQWHLIKLEAPLRIVLSSHNIDLTSCNRNDPRLSHLF